MTFVTSPVVVRSLVNVARYPTGGTYGPRTIPTFEFVWSLDASFTWEILGPDGRPVESYELAPGIMALSTRGTGERYTWSRRAGSHAYIHFELPGDVDSSGWPRMRAMSECPPLSALADSLFDIAVADESTAHRRSGQAIGLMLDAFLDTPVGSRGGHAVDVVDRAVAAVREVWSRDGLRIVVIDEIADAIGVSGGYLSRSFATRYGIGLAGAMELIRLGRAAVALQRTTLTIARIADECGFSDEFHLSRRFSRTYGVPPGAYRRHLSAAEPLAPLIERRLMSLWNALVIRSSR